MSTEGPSQAAIVITWISFVIAIILTIFCANVVYCYFVLWDCADALQKRRPKLILIIGSMSLVYIAMNPAIMLMSMQIFGNVPFANPLLYAMFQLTGLSSLYLLLYRGYLIYYDIQFNKALQDREWRLHVNPDEKNWYLRHKQTWGNGTRIAIILGCFYSLFCLIGIGRAFATGVVDLLCRAVLVFNLLICLIPMLVLYFKYPKFDDHWQIRKEVKLASLTSIVITVLYLLLSAVIGAQPPDPPYMISVFCGLAIEVALIMTTMYYPLKKFGLPRLGIVAKRQATYEKNVGNVLYSPEMSNSDNLGRRDSTTVKMTDMFQDENGFTMFARHLTKEFAVENLLFFVETQQFYQWFMRVNESERETLLKCEDEDRQFIFDVLMDIKFPANAPNSRIVFDEHGDDSTDDPFICFAKIFIKYIQNSAYFAVNLSSFQRADLYKRLGLDPAIDYTNTEPSVVIQKFRENSNLRNCFHLLDRARYEIFKLMKNGFVRFKISDAFVENYSKIAKNMEKKH